MSLGSVRQEEEVHPQHFNPKTEGTCKAHSYSWRHRKKMPKHVACSDGILAFNMHMVAEEISKRVQTFTATPKMSQPSYLAVQCLVCDRCVAPLVLPGNRAVGTRKALLLSSQHGLVCQTW